MFFEKKWWKEAIGYQIYLRSFKDSNNDGIGDINGIREKLAYFNYLGVNLLWITPFYLSPMDDNGYDVANFKEVDPSYGTLDDFKNLINEAHQRGIRIIIDFVMNHTSDEHPWFIESRKSKNNKYRNYYYWSEGKEGDGTFKEPTNWASFFGGSAWEKDNLTNEYYLKIFSKKMPDLNYNNKEVREEMKEIAKYWLNLGVDGFRIDAVAHLGKSELKDSRLVSKDKYKKDWRQFSNLEVVFEYLKEFDEEVFSQYDIVTIGEVGGEATTREALKYTNLENGSLKMAFNFDHIWSNNINEITNESEEISIDLKNLKEVFNKWQTDLYKKSWLPIYWMNHDFPRLLSQYGNKDERFLSGSMLATTLYFMWGTPFVYQGEEIGMSNYPFKNSADFDDVSIKEILNNKDLNDNDKKEAIYKQALISRDNARTVMSWDDSIYGGFSSHKPWFHVHPDFSKVNVNKDLKNPNSLLNYYKKIIEIRKSEEYLNTLVYGSYKQLLSEHEKVYVYLRELDKKILVVVNFFNEQVTINLPELTFKKIILSNYPLGEISLKELRLRPYESVVLEVIK